MARPKKSEDEAFWHKVPISLAVCPATVRFRRMLRTGPLGHAYLVNLWGWCWDRNRSRRFHGDLGAQHMADSAGWRGNPVRLAGALVASGFATVDGTDYVLNDLVTVSTMSLGTLPRVTETVQDRTVTVPFRDGNGTVSVQLNSDGTAQNASSGPLSARALAGESPESRVQSEVQEPSSGTPDMFTSTASTGKPLPIEVIVTNILIRWQERSGKNGASIEGPKAKDRRKRIKARLSERFSERDLIDVADGMVLDPFLMGTDPACTKPGGYRDVETVYRDAAQCERLIALARGETPRGTGRPPAPPSPASRRFTDDD